MKPLTRHLLTWVPILIGFVCLYFTYGILPYVGILLIGFGLGQMPDLLMEDESSHYTEEQKLSPNNENKHLNNSSSK